MKNNSVRRVFCAILLAAGLFCFLGISCATQTKPAPEPEFIEATVVNDTEGNVMDLPVVVVDYDEVIPPMPGEIPEELLELLIDETDEDVVVEDPGIPVEPAEPVVADIFVPEDVETMELDIPDFPDYSTTEEPVWAPVDEIPAADTEPAYEEPVAEDDPFGGRGIFAEVEGMTEEEPENGDANDEWYWVGDQGIEEEPASMMTSSVPLMAEDREEPEPEQEPEPVTVKSVAKKVQKKISELPTWLTAAVCGAAVIMIILCIIVTVRMKKRKKETVDKSPDQDPLLSAILTDSLSISGIEDQETSEEQKPAEIPAESEKHEIPVKEEIHETHEAPAGKKEHGEQENHDMPLEFVSLVIPVRMIPVRAQDSVRPEPEKPSGAPELDVPDPPADLLFPDMKEPDEETDMFLSSLMDGVVSEDDKRQR